MTSRITCYAAPMSQYHSAITVEEGIATYLDRYAIFDTPRALTPCLARLHLQTQVRRALLRLIREVEVRPGEKRLAYADLRTERDPRFLPLHEGQVGVM